MQRRPREERKQDMSHDELRMARRKAVGTKQTIKALERGEAKAVYLARDADQRITTSVLELCKTNGVEIIYVDTMAQLGKACGIEVGAASVAILVS
jgi:large subunit ribosomal protein L7A